MTGRLREVVRVGMAAIVAALFFAPATLAVVSAEVVLKNGDPLGPSVVTGVEAPFTDGNGKVGFVGSLADNQRFIWWDQGPVFFSSEALPDVLTGGESSMGVSDTGGFIYSPSVNGNDAVVTHEGILLKKTDPVPPLQGLYSSFNSRPAMIPNSYCYWIGGTATTPTGSTSNRHLFLATDPGDPASIVRILGGGDIIEGKMVKTTASNFDFWISDNGAHHIHLLDMNVTLNEHVYLNGAFVAQEGSPTGQGDNWSAFDIVGVNNNGDYIFTGDTDGPTATDEFVAYNGTIVVREGDTIDGVLLLSGYALRAASINDLGQVAHIWGLSSTEHLFFGDGASLGDSRAILNTGDEIDVDGNETADYVVTDFNASASIGPGLDLAEDSYVYVHVDLVPVGGGTSVEAVLRLGVASPASVIAAGETRRRTIEILPSRPNPMTEGTGIRYLLRDGARVRVGIYDTGGRRVLDLFEGWQAAGMHERGWNGRGASGARVPSGGYYIRVETPEGAETQKLIVLD